MIVLDNGAGFRAGVVSQFAGEERTIYAELNFLLVVEELQQGSLAFRVGRLGAWTHPKWREG
jgi:hypothetical protein